MLGRVRHHDQGGALGVEFAQQPHDLGAMGAVEVAGGLIGRQQGRASGSGVGLTVVRQLVHGLGGTVRHARRPGGGACFVLTF